MNVIALSGYPLHKAQPLQGDVLWSDDLKLAILALSKQLSSFVRKERPN
jgi:hypothetical protein